VENRIAPVTVNRPKALNALTQEVLRSLEEVIDGLSDGDEAKMVFLTDAGDRALVVGADIAAMQGMAPEDARRFSRMGQRVFGKIEHMGQMVIAAVNGFALGGAWAGRAKRLDLCIGTYWQRAG
jgi:enoyl-CoA hydratase